MADSQINISLSIADNAAQKVLDSLTSKAGSTDKALSKLGDSGTSSFSQIAVSVGKATGVFEIFEGNLAANVAGKAMETLIETAHKLFDVFVTEGIKAAEDNEAAINSLNVALAASGQYSKDTSEDFIKFAEGLQATTKYSHDVIIQNAAMIESLTQLGPGALKQATTAAANLATVMHRDLPSAAEAVAKAANGNITALNKMGLQIQQGSTNAETFANALKALEGRFGTAAAGEVNTYSGAVAQMGNAFKDLTEQIGNVIVQNPVVVNTLKEATVIFGELSETIKSQKAYYIDLVGQGISVFIGGAAGLVTAIDVVVRAFQTMYGVFKLVNPSLSLLSASVRAMTGDFKGAAEQVGNFTKSAATNLSALGKNGDGQLSNLAVQLLKLKEAADKGLDALKNGATTSVAPVNSTTGKVKELTAEMKLAQAQAKAFAESLLKAADDGKTGATATVTLAKATADAQDAVNKQLLANKVIDEQEYVKRKQAIDNQYLQTELKAEDTQYQAELKLLDKALATKQINDQQYFRARTQLDDQYLVKQEATNQKIVQSDAESKKMQRKAEEDLYHARVDTLSNLSQLMGSKNREMFEIGKAASMANIAINTFNAAVEAYNSLASIPYVGPALGAAAAAAVTAYGAEQEANVAATTFNYASGGIVPGNSFTGDRLSANVNSGEMILNDFQQATLFKLANGQGANQQPDKTTHMLLGKIANALEAGQSIIIDGKEIMNTVRRQIKGGRSFA